MMRKSKDNILWGLFYSFLFVLEMLFIQGICVNVSAFYDGLSGGWIALFTFMLCSGAIALYVLLQVIVKNKQWNQTIQNYTVCMCGIILMLLACIDDIRFGILLCIVQCIWFVCSYKNIRGYIMICVWLCSVSVCQFAFYEQWIAMPRCLTIVFSEAILLSFFKKESIGMDNEKCRNKSIFVLGIIKTMLFCSVLYMMYHMQIHMIHTIQEQSIYNPSKEYIQMGIGMLLCGGICLIQKWMIKRNAITQMETYVSERLAYCLCMFILAFMLYRSSFVLTLTIVLVMLAYIALEGIQMYFIDIHLDAIRNIVFDIFAWLVLVLAQSVYDGIYVDASVVLISVISMLCIGSLLRLFISVPRDEEI